MLNKNAIEIQLENGSIYVDDGINKLGENYIIATLGDTLKIYDEHIVDIKHKNKTKTIIIPEEGLLLEPNKLYLGRTNEYTKTHGFVPMLSGIPELAVLGVEIHITAGFGDNGFEGTWTLEIRCANPTILYPNMEIGRFYYNPCITGENIDVIKYNGKYFKQIDTTASRYDIEYKISEKEDK